MVTFREQISINMSNTHKPKTHCFGGFLCASEEKPNQHNFFDFGRGNAKNPRSYPDSFKCHFNTKSKANLALFAIFASSAILPTHPKQC